MIIAPRISLPVAFQSVSARTIAANITSNEGRVGWVSSSPGRSTSDILWSCFSILLVCTWKCIHFNVSSDEERDAGWHKFLWETVPYWPQRLLWRRWFKRVGFIIMIILAPEIGVAIAMDQYLFARESQEGKAVIKEVDVDEWEKVKEDNEMRGMSEGKVVEEGPSRIEEHEISVGKQEADAIYRTLQKEGFERDGWRFFDKDSERNGRWFFDGIILRGKPEITKTHAFLANMGGFRIKILFLDHQRKDEVCPPPVELLLQD
jgi:hypothetical protein